jgi:transcriptional regulator with XRE-family HTH domain
MPDKQKDKFLVDFSVNLKDIVRECGKSLYELANDIEITEAGLHKMLTTGSMKIKTLKKIAEALNRPITAFFNGDTTIQSIKGSYNTQQSASTWNDQQAEYKYETKALKDKIVLLERTINDKEEIIKHLKEKKG